MKWFSLWNMDRVHDPLWQLCYWDKMLLLVMWCPKGGKCPLRAQTAHQHVILLPWLCNSGHHFTLLLLNPSFLAFYLPCKLWWCPATLTTQENGWCCCCFSGLLLKWILGLIQLIKTQLMFVLMAPQRQPERQASVIPASDEASAQTLYGLQMGGNSPTVQHPTM